MVDIELEHVLLFVIVAFILYYFIGRGCGCSNGFRVGGKKRYKSIPQKSMRFHEIQGRGRGGGSRIIKK